MSKKNEYKKINLQDVMLNLSDKTKSDMTWSVGDHKFLVSIFDAHTRVTTEMVTEKLKDFANGTWEELKNFIVNQYEGISNQLQIQSDIIKDIRGKQHDIQREMGILRQEVKLIKESVCEDHKLIEDHEKRILLLERDVKDIKEKIK